MNNKGFVFVGYLVQEPPWRGWPLRNGYHVASIEREIHPSFDKFQWNIVGDVQNPTKFLTEFPRIEALSLEPHDCKSVLHKGSPGWVVSGYSLPLSVVEQRTMISVDGKVKLQEFAYALRMQRSADGLNLLGYEVVDDDDLFLSILNNCGYTVEQVHEMGGPLNKYSLLSAAAYAERFIVAIKTSPKNRKIIPDHNRGVMVEVWG